MAPWIRALLLGFLAWFVPFAVSFALFSVRQSDKPLFTTLMFLVLLGTAGLLFRIYFMRRALRLGEGLLVGSLWLVINLVLNFPLYAFGPMKMTMPEYYSEVGLGYLTFPLFALLAIPVMKRRVAG